jgi:hypothetical protein
MKIFYLTLMIAVLTCCGQKSNSAMKVEQKQYDSFPSDFEMTNRIFKHYYADGNLSRLSDSQKALCYFFICEGLIDNSGFYSILLETQGEWNSGYVAVLEKAGDAESMKILQQIDQIYKQFETNFAQGELPPELDDESDSFNQELSDRINLLEENWYGLSDQRNQKVKKYLEYNKDEIVRIR